ncbi:MAG TPA: glycerate kinase, partial [Stackebrandtia sp.]|uniref:glycerate kinase n=1 Tax=Stackebrandtia sp. TaxID=2023065 RepID=UPI002D6B1C4D
MTTVVIACDKFKGCLTAAEVADHLADGLRAARVDTRRVPVADGGEGTVAAALAAGFTRHTLTVHGPLGDPVEASFAVKGDQAVIELAEASGLRHCGAPRPPTAETNDPPTAPLGGGPPNTVSIGRDTATAIGDRARHDGAPVSAMNARHDASAGRGSGPAVGDRDTGGTPPLVDHPNGVSSGRGGGTDPLAASSFGTGELLDAARGRGCRRIVLGLGGSACTDGGAGML